MKKAKPSKGSARTKKFDAGGLAALAGLGTLAYLMSRKKKGEDGGDSSKFDELKSVEKTKSLKEQIGRGDGGSPMSAEMKRAMAASKGRDELIPEGADEAVMRSDTYAPPKPKPAAANPAAAKPAAAKPAAAKTTTTEKPASQSFPVSTAGKSNAELPSKPYPKGVKGRDTDPYTRPSMGLGLDERQQARKDFLARRAAEAKEKMDAEAAKKKARDEAQAKEFRERQLQPMKKGGKVKKYASGGTVKSSASKRADGIAQRGKTKGRIC